MDEALRAELLRRATEARGRAYAPYSRFKVGAALLAEDGVIFSGCNVENASYGLTLCAERNALFHAVAEGRRRFSALAVCADADPPATPCGACRQALAEFCPELEIYLLRPGGPAERVMLSEIFPRAFGMK